MHRIFLEIGSFSIAWFGVMMVAAFFSGFVSMMVYFLWWFMGRWYSTVTAIG